MYVFDQMAYENNGSLLKRQGVIMLKLTSLIYVNVNHTVAGDFSHCLKAFSVVVCDYTGIPLLMKMA